MAEGSELSGTPIGGAIVTIGGDIAPLEQVVKQAEQITRRLEERSPEVKLRLKLEDADTRKIVSEVGGMVGDRTLLIVPKLDVTKIERSVQAMMANLQSKVGELKIVARVDTSRAGSGSFATDAGPSPRAVARDPAPGGMLGPKPEDGGGRGPISNYGKNYGPFMADGSFVDKRRGLFGTDIGKNQGLGSGSDLNPNTGMIGRIVGGAAIREGVRAVTSLPEYNRKLIEAGNNQDDVLKADMARRDELTTGVIGGAVGLLADPTGSRRAGVDLILRNREDQEEAGKLVSREHETRLVASEQSMVLQSPDEYTKRKLAVDNAYEDKNRALQAEKRATMLPFERTHEGAIAAAEAERDTVKYRVLKFGGILNDTQGKELQGFEDRYNTRVQTADNELKFASQNVNQLFAPREKIVADDRDFEHKRIDADRAEYMRGLSSQGRAIGFEREAALLKFSGDPVGGLKAQREAGFETLRDGLQGELQKATGGNLMAFGMKNPGMLLSMVANGMGKLSAYKEDTAGQLGLAQSEQDSRHIVAVGQNDQLRATGEELTAVAGHDTQAAYLARRKGERADGLSEINSRIENKGTSESDRKDLIEQRRLKYGDADAKGGFAGGTDQQQTDVGLKQLRENEQAENTRLVSQATANRLRIIHDATGAELAMLQGLKKNAETIGDEATRKNAVAEIDSQIQLTKDQHIEKVRSLTNAATAAETIAGQIKSRDFFGAEKTAFDNETKDLTVGAAPDELKSIIARRNSEWAGKEAEHDFQHKITGEDNQTRVAAADDFIAGRTELAQDRPRIRSLEREVELASPEDRPGVKAAATEELKAMKSQLTGGHGGALIHGMDWGEAGAAILESRMHGRKEAGARAAIDDGLNQVQNGGAPAGSPPAAAPGKPAGKGKPGKPPVIIGNPNDPHRVAKGKPGDNRKLTITDPHTAADENKLLASVGEAYQNMQAGGSADEYNAAKAKLATFRKMHPAVGGGTLTANGKTSPVAVAAPHDTAAIASNPHAGGSLSSGSGSVSAQLSQILAEIRKVFSSLAQHHGNERFQHAIGTAGY